MQCQDHLPISVANGPFFLRLSTTDCEFTCHENQSLEEIENEIADILAGAIYSYLIRKNLVRKIEVKDENKEASLIIK